MFQAFRRMGRQCRSLKRQTGQFGGQFVALEARVRGEAGLEPPALKGSALRTVQRPLRRGGRQSGGSALDGGRHRKQTVPTLTSYCTGAVCMCVHCDFCRALLEKSDSGFWVLKVATNGCRDTWDVSWEYPRGIQLYTNKLLEEYSQIEQKVEISIDSAQKNQYFYFTYCTKSFVCLTLEYANPIERSATQTPPATVPLATHTLNSHTHTHTRSPALASLFLPLPISLALGLATLLTQICLQCRPPMIRLRLAKW